ncbi:hypothetical protein LCGC14_3010580 [marine sediment metagenome]|uniref:Uncharacterized protein n=1 Tax=marine sediment metagenome TaxID=412755 RepID=A0A0F8ZPG7_9ZZZZ
MENIGLDMEDTGFEMELGDVSEGLEGIQTIELGLENFY